MRRAICDHDGMTLQLDPRHQLVWRSPTSIQLGADRAVVVLDDVTPAQERMLSALVVGVTSPGFDLVARAAGADAGMAHDMLRVVRPALRDESSGQRPAQPARVLMSGTGPTAHAVTRLLCGAGLDVRLHDPLGEPEPTDIAVIVDHFVVDPSARGYWLRRDIPHLPLVIGDSTVRIGPFIEPGAGPCLWCLDRFRVDADPAWPAIASQLLGRRSAADRGVVAVEAAAVAARRVLERIAAPQASAKPGRAPTGRAKSTTLQVSSGATSTELWARHPECGCATLAESANPDAFPSGPPQLRPTTERETVVPA